MIVIDTDGGVDDILALSFACRLLKEEEFAISVVYGNMERDSAARNSREVLSLLGSDAPIYLGATAAQDGFTNYAGDVHAVAGSGADAASEQRLRPLADLIDRLRSTGPVDVLGLGPATNVAEIVDGVGADRVRRATLMGGSLFDRGNVSSCAEFNFMNDPYAVRDLLAADVPVEIVPLDLCRKVVFNRSSLENMRAFGRAAEMLIPSHEHYMEYYRRTEAIEGCFPHDSIALLAFLFPERFDRWEFGVRIETHGEARGCLTYDPDSPLRLTAVLGGDLPWVRSVVNDPAVALEASIGRD